MKNDFKVGDRVRATSKTNGDFAEFTITALTNRVVGSKNNSFFKDQHFFELIETADILPSEPGIYIPKVGENILSGIQNLRVFKRYSDGEWWEDRGDLLLDVREVLEHYVTNEGWTLVRLIPEEH